MRRPRMRASELQFRCLGCVVATVLFVSVFALSLRAPSPSLVGLDDWADEGPPTAIVAPVVSSECDGFGLSSPLPPAPPGALSLFSLGDWGVRGMTVGSDAQLAVAWVEVGGPSSALPLRSTSDRLRARRRHVNTDTNSNVATTQP